MQKNRGGKMSGFCDIHTHILPGIDDGARDWDMCLEMIDRAWEGGVRRIIATPHYLPWKDKKPNPLHIVRLCNEVQRRARRELGYEIIIYPGQEIYYHVDMIDGIRRGEILTMAGTRHILVEFPIDISAGQLKQAVRHICEAQYLPILAHIERYECLRNSETMEETAGLGALFQINIKSLQGGVLNQTTRWCRHQLLERKIDFLASDMHNLSSRPPTSYEMLDWVGKKLDREYQRDILLRNALRMGI